MPTCPHCQHTWDDSQPVFNNYERDFPTFLALADNVLAHVRETGIPVLSADDPMQRKIGFETPSQDRRWTITLTRIKAGDPENTARYTLYRTYLREAAGRAMIAAAWSEGREPTEPYRPAA